MDTTWPASEIDPPIQPLTREQAQALLARNPVPRVAWLLMRQAALGVTGALLWWWWSGSQVQGLSALYGVAVAVVPGVLMARAVTGGWLSSSVGGWVLWEFVKLVAVGVLMALAPWLIKPLSWPVMLLAMVLSMKMVVVAVLWQGRRRKN